MTTLKYWFAYSKAVLLQAYFDLKEWDELPFQLMRQEFEDRRRVVVRPQRPQKLSKSS